MIVIPNYVYSFRDSLITVNKKNAHINIRPKIVVSEGINANTHLLIQLINQLTPWHTEPGGSMLHSQGHSNNPYPEPNQPNYTYTANINYISQHVFSRNV